jgi:hypothetical protein
MVLRRSLLCAADGCLGRTILCRIDPRTVYSLSLFRLGHIVASDFGRYDCLFALLTVLTRSRLKLIALILVVLIGMIVTLSFAIALVLFHRNSFAAFAHSTLAAQVSGQNSARVNSLQIKRIIWFRNDTFGVAFQVHGSIHIKRSWQHPH